jgi:hypothetical protein
MISKRGMLMDFQILLYCMALLVQTFWAVSVVKIDHV